MNNYNIFFSSFSHAKSSTWYKKSNYINWNHQVKNNDVSFYVDQNSILNGVENKNDGKIKYLWHLESPIINTNFIKIIEDNLEEVLDTYKLIFTYSDELLKLNPKFVFSPANGFWIENPKVYKKTKLISMISSSKTLSSLQQFRVNFAKTNTHKLDLYGDMNKKIEKKELGLNDYMFSVCIENCEHDTYFTEKILDCFATGTIPIYKGTRKIINHFNEDGILFLDDIDIDNLNEDIYFSKIDSVIDNFERVLKYDVLEDWIYDKYIKNKTN